MQRGIWIFIACSIVVAVWNSFPHDPKGFYKELGHKSDQLRGVAGDVVTWLNLDSLGNKASGTGSATGTGTAK